MKQNKEDVLKNKIMVKKIILKTQGITSRKNPNRPAEVSDSQKGFVRKKPARALIKTVDSSKLKTCDIIPQSKGGNPSKNTKKNDSLNLNTRQRNPLGSGKLKEKRVRSTDCKSLKTSVGRKASTQQNSLENVNKVNTRTKSLKMELRDVNVTSKQNIHNNTRSNRKTSSASVNKLPNCVPKGHPHQTNPENGLNIESSAIKNSNCQAKDVSVDKSNKIHIFNIEETILDMQQKILKLEQKSVLDDEKINNLKTIMLKQRNNEIKMLLDEKETELLLRMNLLYVDCEPERVCKLCLQLFDKKESLTSLLNDQTLVSLINTTLDMEIELSDGTPTGLCDDCLLQIKRYDWMKRRSHKANTMSIKFIAMKKGYNDSDYPDKSPFALDAASSDTYLLEDVNDEDITEEDQPFHSIKIEDAFSLDSPNNVRIPLDLTFIKEEPQTEEDRPTSLVVTESVTTHPKSKTVKICRCCRTIFTNQWTLNKHRAYCCQRFKCIECTKCFFDSRLFRLHKLRRQSCVSTDVFRYCIICNVSFRWRWQLVFHVFNHKQQSNCKNTFMDVCFD